MIGLSNDSFERHNRIKADFVADAHSMNKYLTGIHPSTKLPYMEVQYPQTSRKLCTSQQEMHSQPQTQIIPKSTQTSTSKNSEQTGMINTNYLHLK